MSVFTFYQAASVQTAVMSWNRNGMIVSVDADVFSGKYVLHGKTVAGSIRKTDICKDAGNILLLLKQVIISDYKFIA